MNGERKIKLYRVSVILRLIEKYAQFMSEKEYIKLVDETIDYIIFGRQPSSEIALSAGLSVENILPGDVPKFEFQLKNPAKRLSETEEGGAQSSAGAHKDEDSSTVDLGKCERYGKSYVVLLPNKRTKPGTYCKLAEEVLNDTYIAVLSGSEGNFRDSIKNPYEEVLFRVEDDEHELDILIGQAQSTIRVLQNLRKNLKAFQKGNSVEVENLNGEKEVVNNSRDYIEATFLPYHFLTIKNIIMNRTSCNIESFKLFKSNTALYIDTILIHVRSELNQYVYFRRGFGAVWNKVFSVSCIKSKDYQAIHFKLEDKKLTSPKYILSEVRKVFYLSMVEGSVHDFHMQFRFQQNSIVPGFPELMIKSQADQQKYLYSASSYPGYQGPSQEAWLVLQDAIQLITAAGEKSLSQSESEAMNQWVQRGLPWLLRPLKPTAWPRSDMQAEGRQVMYYGSKGLYVVIALCYIIHSRLSLAKQLAGTFQSQYWDFSTSKKPVPTSETQLELSLLCDEVQRARHQQTASIANSSGSKEEKEHLKTWLSASTNVFWSQDVSNVPGSILEQMESIAENISAQYKNEDLASKKGAAKLVSSSEDEEGGNVQSSRNAASRGGKDALEGAQTDTAHIVSKYATFLELVKSILKGSLEQSEYEYRCLVLFGQAAYPLYSLHRVLMTAVTQIRAYLAEPERSKWIELLKEYNSKLRYLQLNPYLNRLQNAQAIEEFNAQYLEKISACFSEHDYFFQFLWDPLGCLQIKLIAKKPLTDPETPTGHWKQYIRYYLSPKHSNINITKRHILLPRNIRKRLPPRLRCEDLFFSTPSCFMQRALSDISSQIASHINTQCKIKQSTKICFVAYSEDLMFHKKRPGRFDINGSNTRRKHPVDALEKIVSELKAHPVVADRSKLIKEQEQEIRLEEIALSVFDNDSTDLQSYLPPSKKRAQGPRKHFEGEEEGEWNAEAGDNADTPKILEPDDDDDNAGSEGDAKYRR